MLTRQQLVDAAVGLLDERGIEGLSMRNLGARLGVAPTAMYWHVRNKGDLVVLAADQVWNEIALPPSEPGEWRAIVEGLGTSVFAMIVSHPWLVTAMSTHLIYGPGKARFDDHLIGVLETAGLSPGQADLAATAVVATVLGVATGVTADAAWRARRRSTATDGSDTSAHELNRISEAVEPYPRLRARVPAPLDTILTEPTHTAEPVLAVVLDGVARMLAGRQ